MQLSELQCCVATLLEKTAADRMTKKLRALYRAGKHKELAELAGKLHRGGFMKDTPGGIQVDKKLEELGRGFEGVAVKVIGPHGLEVRKQYDPRSALWSPELQRDKEKLLRAAQEVPITRGVRVAKLYNAHHGPKDLIVHRMEHIPGEGIGAVIRRKNESLPALQHRLRPINAHLDSAAARAGLAGHRDAAFHEGGMIKYNPGNIKVLPSGEHVVIDVMPLTTGGATTRNLGMVPGYRKYFPKGPAAHGETPLVDLAKKLGPGSRQQAHVPGEKTPTIGRFLRMQNERRGIPMPAAAPAVAEAAAHTTPLAASTMSHVPPGLREMVQRAVPGLKRAAPWALGAVGVAGLGLGALALRRRQQAADDRSSGDSRSART